MCSFVPAFAFSAALRTLRQTSEITSSYADEVESGHAKSEVVIEQEGEGNDDTDGGESILGVVYAAIDAVLAGSEAAIEKARKPGWALADPPVYDLDWHENGG